MDTEVEREERAIYLIVLAACAPILIALGIDRRPIDGGNTLMLIFVMLGFAGVIAGLAAIRRHRVPPARALKATPVSSREAGTQPPLP